MRERAGVVILRDGKILLMLRRHKGHDYYILPGGTIEAGETPEIAAIREIKEETGVDVVLDRKLFEHDVLPGTGSKYDKQHYYLAKSFEGEPVLSGAEAEMSIPDDHYELHWVPLENLKNTEIYHPSTKELLVESLVDKIGNGH